MAKKPVHIKGARRKPDDPDRNLDRVMIAVMNPEFGGLVGNGPQNPEWRKNAAKTSENRSHINPEHPDNKWCTVMPFSPTKKLAYVKLMAKYNRPAEAARTLGVTVQTVNKHLRNDDDFRHMVDEALLLYVDKVARTAYEHGVEGVLENVYYQGKVIDQKRVVNPRILELEMKKTNPAYRDNNNVNVSVTASVIAVPASLDAPAWDAAFEDVTPAKVETVKPNDEER